MVEIKNTGGLTLKEWQRKLKSGEELTPEEQEQIDRFGKAMSSTVSNAMSGLFSGAEVMKSMARAQREMIERVAEAANFVKPMIESARRMQEQILESTRYFAESFSGVGKRLGEWLRQSFESLRILFEKSHIFLIVRASTGDVPSAAELGRLWWKLKGEYFRLQRAKGGRPTEKEFQALVMEACLKTLKQKENSVIPIYKVAGNVFWYIVNLLLVDWAEVYESASNEGGMQIEVIADNGEESKNYLNAGMSVYRNAERETYLFVRTAAKAIGVTPQTVRNWARYGGIRMVHQSYHSKIRHGIIKVGLLPYEDTLISELARLKQEREDRRAHKIDGYYTRSQAVEELKMLGVCKETLAKWDKAGKLVPKRINGIRYYTKDDLKTAAKLFLDSPSPRVKDKKDQFLSLVKERNLSLAEAF